MVWEGLPPKKYFTPEAAEEARSAVKAGTLPTYLPYYLNVTVLGEASQKKETNKNKRPRPQKTSFFRAVAVSSSPSLSPPFSSTGYLIISL